METALLQFGLESELALVAVTAIAALMMTFATGFLVYVSFSSSSPSGWTGEEPDSQQFEGPTTEEPELDTDDDGSQPA